MALLRIGTVAYKLELPDSSRIHLTFHISQLKKHLGAAKTYPQSPLITAEGNFDIGPLRRL